MQTYSQMSGQHIQASQLTMGGLSHPKKGWTLRQKPWHNADDTNFRREIFSQIIKVLQRRGLDKKSFDIAKDIETALYFDAASKEEYADLSTLEHRIYSVMNLMIKIQSTGQQAQFGPVSSRPSYVHGNMRDPLTPGQGGAFNMVNTSTPFSQVQSGGPAIGFGTNLPAVAAQIPLGSDGSRFSGNQSKPLGFPNGGSWMIPTPGLNISNPAEPVSNRASSDTSSDLLCTTGSGLPHQKGKVILTNNSTSNNAHMGNTGHLEQGFVKDTFNFTTPNLVQHHPSLSVHPALQQQSHGVNASDGYAGRTNLLVDSNSFCDPTFSTGLTTCISRSVSLPPEGPKLDIPSQQQDLQPPPMFVSEHSYQSSVSAENPILPLLSTQKSEVGFDISNQCSTIENNPTMAHQFSYGAPQDQCQPAMEPTQLTETSQRFGSRGNHDIELMAGDDRTKSNVHSDPKLYLSHQQGSNMDGQVECCEKLCQASSADTGQSEVVSNDEAPNQVKEVGNVLPSQQVKRQQWLLIFLRHVSRCTDSSHCNVAHCAVGREAWKHLISCQDYPCPYPRCMPLKSLLSHHQKCRSLKCTVCGPVRNYFSHQAAAMGSKMQKGPKKESVGSVNDISMHEVDSSPVVKRIKIETIKPDAGPAYEQPHLISTTNHDGISSSVIASKTADNEPKKLSTSITGVDPESLEKSTRLPLQRVDSPIESSVSQGSLLNIKSFPPNDVKLESNPVKKDGTLQVTGSRTMQAAEKPSNQTSVITTFAPSKGSSDSGKLVKAKISGISYIENFSPEQIRQHIATLRKWIGQNKCKAERNQAMQKQMSTSACSACAIEDLYFDPIPNFCTQCGCRIKRNATYYTTGSGESTLSFCGPCYSAIRHDTVETYGSRFQKSMLIKKKNDEQRAEGWVECDKCNKWQHQVCVLFNARMNKERSEYVCPECCILEMERAERKPRPANAMPGAKDLPRTILGDYVQERLDIKLKQERVERAKALGKNCEEVPTAEGLVVRVLSSIDKKLEVKPKFLEVFQDENYPKDFYYKSKMLMLFQEIEGVEVCLFGMYVQEFGAESPQPNSRWVYLSYLDSVKYFRPDVKTVKGEALRTYVYHEILIAYLDYSKKRGFSSCYIWACPPLKGDDYILYCHPEIQKTPKTDKLREWYLSMIAKAKREKIVVSNKNLYDYFFTSMSHGDCKAKITAASLPYFDGDYWPGAAEDLLHQLQKDDGSPQSQKGKTKKLPLKRTTKTSTHAELGGNISMDLQLMHKLGQSIVAMKEDFMIVHLHHACSRCRTFIYSGLRWVCQQCVGNFQLCSSCYEEHEKLEDEERHPAGKKDCHHLSVEELEDIPVDTTDKDEIMESEFFDSRQAFLSLCQGNQYQFDTLRRAKHSSMMILYHLHNPSAPAFITSCTLCHSELEEGQGYKCSICTDFDVCHACYPSEEVQNHPHKLVARSSGSDPTADDRKQRVLQVRMMLEVLVHASKCADASCQFAKCRNIKDLFRHGLSCTKRVAGGCAFCKRMWFLLTAHARGCKESICNVPRCMDIRKHLKRAQLQQESRRRAAVNEMMRQRAAEAAGSQ